MFDKYKTKEEFIEAMNKEQEKVKKLEQYLEKIVKDIKEGKNDE